MKPTLFARLRLALIKAALGLFMRLVAWLLRRAMARQPKPSAPGGATPASRADSRVIDGESRRIDSF